ISRGARRCGRQGDGPCCIVLRRRQRHRRNGICRLLNESMLRWHAHGEGVREIARQLGRAASTISRELRRNAATRSGGFEYLAVTAQWHADRSARRPKPAKLLTNPALRTYVQDRLAGNIATPGARTIARPHVPWMGRRHGRRQTRLWARAWSPEQIARRLLTDFPEDNSMR